MIFMIIVRIMIIIAGMIIMIIFIVLDMMTL